MEKLRIGFLVDDTNVNYYVSDLVNYVDAHSSFESPVFITGYSKKKERLSIFKRVFALSKHSPLKALDLFLGSVFRRLIHRVERRIVLKKFPNFYESVDFSNNGSIKKVLVRGNWSKSGLILRFDEDDICEIESLKLDCIIRCEAAFSKGIF